MSTFRPPTQLSRVVVLGNSGSLLSLPPQRRWGEDLVIGTNRILRPGIDGRRFNPDVMVLSDARPIETDRHMLEDFNGPVLCADWLGTDIATDFFPAVPSRTRHRTQPIPHIHSNQWGDPVWSINSVTFQAAQLAMRMLAPGGMVIVAGAERTWPGKDRPHHFYDTRHLHTGRKPFRVSQDFTFQWGVLAELALGFGIHIVECSPWEDLRLPLRHIDL